MLGLPKSLKHLGLEIGPSLYSNSGTSTSLGVANVLFIAGQSNAVVLGTDVLGVPADISGPQANINIWRLDTNVWETYNPGTNSDFLISDPPCIATARTPPTCFGPEAEFLKWWKKYRPTDKLWIIKVAKGNSGLQVAARQGTIGVWDTGQTNELYVLHKAAKVAAYAALAAQGLVPNVIGTFWMQGEADAVLTGTASNYQTAATAFLTQYRAEIMGGSTSKIVIGRISQAAAWTFSAAVRTAQATIGAGTNFNWFSTDTYTLQADAIHYTPLAIECQGTDLYYSLMGKPALFYDDFNRQNGNLENSVAWTRIDGAAGAIAISSNALNGPGTDINGATYLAPDTGSLNHYVQHKVTGLNINALCCRVTNLSNYLSMRPNNGTTSTYEVVQKIAGVTTVLATGLGTPSISDIVRLEANGTTWTLKRNGTQLGTGSFGAGLTSQQCGYVQRFNGVVGDDFESGPLP